MNTSSSRCFQRGQQVCGTLKARLRRLRSSATSNSRTCRRMRRAWVVAAAALLAAAPAAGFIVPALSPATGKTPHLGRATQAMSRDIGRLKLACSMRSVSEAQEPLGRRQLLAAVPAAAVAAALLPSMLRPASAGAGDLVLVIGATSTAGQDLCRDLLAAGFKVRGLTRRADDVKQAVVGTELASVEWVNGNLKEFSDLAPAMRGVKKVVFTPLLATKAGSDPNYFQSAVFQDIEMNRVVYGEALGELIRLGKEEGVDKFVLVSSAGVGLKTPSTLALDEVQNKKDEARGRWRPTRLEPAMLNEDCVKWKLRGEEMLKSSGLPYTIVRSYSPPPRPWNDPSPSDFNIAILQGGSEGVSGVINRSDLGRVTAQALISPKTTGTTFEAINVPKAVPDDQVSMVKQMNPTFPNWKEALNTLSKDAISKDAPVSLSASPAAGTSSAQLSARRGEQGGRSTGRQISWDGDTMVLKSAMPETAVQKKRPVISFQ